ncbi:MULTISPECIES: helix-turn-helix domain-containing protein [Prevotellaceae]|uniref:helix-turn-helix domain-containing protein n=1 Tax=Prevotellaceae TaxID=171552 RepID=UPI0003D3B215|nr:AraC family transcriptional regulator [Prevotella phocaeensis]ETD18428.1 hypothetical protein HMPREF1199_01240 [Hoylesella oralis CC98A]
MDTVCSCNKLFDEKTRHPLVSVINLACPCSKDTIRVDCYAVILRQDLSDEPWHGRMGCDFSDSTVFFRKPKKTIDIACGRKHEQKGQLLMFHPDLLCGTALGTRLADYHFLNYQKTEALHLSTAERKTLEQCFADIEHELEWGIDKYSARLIVNKIEMLLNYCCRYYHRQFITRHDVYAEQVESIGRRVDDELLAGNVCRDGLPRIAAYAAWAGMSEPYFNDMLRKLTGKDFDRFVQFRRIAIAKQMIIAHRQTDASVAAALGFCSTQCFQEAFKKITGVSTEEYR